LRKSLGGSRQIYLRSTTSIDKMSNNSKNNSTDTDKGKWVRVCSVNELKEGEIIAVDVDGKEIMLIKYKNSIYALDRICTHQYADLSMGFLTGDEVTCPLHLSRFRISDGRALNPPAERPLTVYNVKIDGDSVYLLMVD